MRGQRHGEENKRGVGSVAVNAGAGQIRSPAVHAGAGQIHSLGERACGSGSEEKREREEREGNEEGVRFDRSALLEGALRKISYEVFYAEKRQSSDFLFFA